eukprot:scaffold1_cov375-Pavlova_lutheri.AAC.3
MSCFDPSTTCTYPGPVAVLVYLLDSQQILLIGLHSCSKSGGLIHTLHGGEADESTIEDADLVVVCGNHRPLRMDFDAVSKGRVGTRRTQAIVSVRGGPAQLRRSSRRMEMVPRPRARKGRSRFLGKPASTCGTCRRACRLPRTAHGELSIRRRIQRLLEETGLLAVAANVAFHPCRTDTNRCDHQSVQGHPCLRRSVRLHWMPYEMERLSVSSSTPCTAIGCSEWWVLLAIRRACLAMHNEVSCKQNKRVAKKETLVVVGKPRGRVFFVGSMAVGGRSSHGNLCGKELRPRSFHTQFKQQHWSHGVVVDLLLFSYALWTKPLNQLKDIKAARTKTGDFGLAVVTSTPS